MLLTAKARPSLVFPTDPCLILQLFNSQEGLFLGNLLTYLNWWDLLLQSDVGLSF